MNVPAAFVIISAEGSGSCFVAPNPHNGYLVVRKPRFGKLMTKLEETYAAHTIVRTFNAETR